MEEEYETYFDLSRLRQNLNSSWKKKAMVNIFEVWYYEWGVLVRVGIISFYGRIMFALVLMMVLMMLMIWWWLWV